MGYVVEGKSSRVDDDAGTALASADAKAVQQQQLEGTAWTSEGTAAVVADVEIKMDLIVVVLLLQAQDLSYFESVVVPFLQVPSFSELATAAVFDH